MQAGGKSCLISEKSGVSFVSHNFNSRVVRTYLSNMRPLFILIAIFVSSSSSASRGEWYESYKEDLVPKHVPVEAPRIPRVHGVSRGEWHIAYPPVISRNRRNNNDNPASVFVNRIRNEIRRRVDPLRRMFRVKRDTSEADYSYSPYEEDQYPVESNEYAARDEVPNNMSFMDRLRDNLSQMMDNFRSFFSPEEELSDEGSLNTLDRENGQGNPDPSFHHQHPHHGQHSSEQPLKGQPNMLDRMRRNINSMVGRVMNFFNGPPSHSNKAIIEDEFHEFNQEFSPSATDSSFEYSHERNYANHERNSPSFFDGLKNSINWLKDSILGSEGHYPGAPLPPKAYEFEPTERRFGGPPPLSPISPK